MGYLFSPAKDFVAFGVPLLAAVLLLPTTRFIQADFVPTWAHFTLVLATDVAHVWATAFRTYLDRRELLRRWRLLVAAPFLAFGISLAVHAGLGSSVFWTLLAYYAMYHFVKQDLGLLFLYIARGGVRPSKAQLRIEKATLYLGALCPVALWHAAPADEFAWFDAGERFLFRTPAWAVRPLHALWAAAPLLYAASEARAVGGGAAANWGKWLIMGGTYVTWALGTLLLEHQVASLAWLNLFHGVPFILMVGVYCRRRWADLQPQGRSDELLRWLTASWGRFVAALVALALAEEAAWDALVWRTGTYAPPLAQPLSPLGTSVAVAALSTPQLVHYMLDAHIWRFDGSNPGLRDYLLGGQPSSTGATASTPPPPSASHAGEAAANEVGDGSGGEGGEQVARSEEPSKDASA